MSRLTLWVRAGSDGLKCGGDPAAHQLFMLMLWKAELDERLKFDVKTVNEARPPQEFKDAGLRRTPALQIDEDTAFSVEDEIIEELDRYGPPRNRSSEAEDVTADLFRVFAFFIKDVEKDPKVLLGELQRIDDYLQSTGTRFLNGDEPSHIDCIVLPRLHSIRIAAKALKDFDMPTELSFLWMYLKNGYQLKSFTTSCAPDQEIILYWSDRPDTQGLSSAKRAHLAREAPTFTHTIPAEVAAST
ncbi:Transcription initiation factor TFIID subunit [Trichostrongylus colubriformis]|uniref:Transcription initiation factor TFIID subunit n=1 Tax=Trichostrongylus colubriformis TaxID=6319 RepID=A0AAN8FXN1_TRICO